MRIVFAPFAALFLLAASPPLRAAPPPAGNPSRGAEIYESHCGACHSLDANRVGPKHRGVVGRKAGVVPGFNYTRALRTSGIVWTADALDRWLSGPAKMAPGTAMGFVLSSPQDRADVIAYLRQQK
jgi:cytochrome c